MELSGTTGDGMFVLIDGSCGRPLGMEYTDHGVSGTGVGMILEECCVKVSSDD